MVEPPFPPAVQRVVELIQAQAGPAERYKKIVVDGEAVDRLFVDLFVQAHERAPPRTDETGEHRVREHDGGKPLAGKSNGAITSDGGRPLLREVEKRTLVSGSPLGASPTTGTRPRSNNG